MNSSIKDRMKKFLPDKVYKRFTGLISPRGDEYAALVLILEEFYMPGGGGVEEHFRL